MKKLSLKLRFVLRSSSLPNSSLVLAEEVALGVGDLWRVTKAMVTAQRVRCSGQVSPGPRCAGERLQSVLLGHCIAVIAGEEKLSSSRPEGGQAGTGRLQLMVGLTPG